MKRRFSTIDIKAIVNELQKYIGMRVNQVYDVDNKTYLIRLNRYEEKVIILFESGIRIHTTEFEWPKNPSPSGFSMKMRKHLKNKRLEKLSQIGVDRIIDLQFGINDAAYHVILELYDRGNIVLTDFEYTILNILRPRTTGSEDVKFIVRERYPVEKARVTDHFNRDEIYSSLNKAKEGENLKKLLMPLVAFGPALLEHVLLKNNFSKNSAVNKDFKVPADIHRLFLCLDEADALLKDISKNCKGYIIQKTDKTSDSQEIVTNVEFHPYLFLQFADMKYAEFPSFDKAVDNFFSSMEGQKIDMKALQKEKEALKKLENVKKDHEKRLMKLHVSQTDDNKKAQLIEMNSELVDKAITVIRSALANQISWSDIQDIIKKAQFEGDTVAKSIKKLKLDINHFTMLLTNPIIDSDDEEQAKPELVDIDLGYSAHANARKYYDLKRAHAKKEQKTIESSEKAFKNAEKKTKLALKEVAVTTSITKARKVMWFEKFLWFISSENYLVIAGRDIQQNELLVKRYMKPNDLYVHADLHGASSVIIKNPSNNQIPPKTLNEAGTMAVCNSTAWDAKIVTGAWWVYSNQVSKTAPTGEYLTTGSFMIRGKKNYLPPANLIMGFGFMFKLDEECIENHLNDRCERSETESEYAQSEFSESTLEEHNLETCEDSKNELDIKSEESSESEDELETICENTAKEINDETEQIISIPEVEVQSSDEDHDDASSEQIAFPDTEVQLNVLTENKAVVPEGTKMGVVIQEHKKKFHKKESLTDDKIPQNNAKEKYPCQKRGHKGKMKKIKEKYKDQDEEERELRMKILASAGQPKEERKNKNKKQKNVVNQPKQSKIPKESIRFIEKSDENTIVEAKVTIETEKSLIVNSKDVPKESALEIQNNDASDEEVDEETQLSEEIKLLNSLTGCPLPDDTLLFAVPVCAPYSSVLNYKFKIKIIPGSHRRGKAAKTALQLFLHDKAANSREKDLLRSVKDQDISRNLPGKIKIAAASHKKMK